jgi:phosphatidate cytidylyltransferase
MSRILTALVAVPLLLLLILKAPAWMFLALALVFALLCYWELTRLSSKLGVHLLPVGYPLTALAVSAFYPGFPGFVWISVATLLLIGLAAVLTRKPGLETLAAIAGTAFAILYAGALLGTMVGLRVAPDERGRLWILFLLAVIMAGDAGAFYVGRALGKKPLAPILSPKKTVAGLWGGIVVSVATAILLRFLTLPHLALQTAIGLGLSLAIVGVIGDLFESLLKRSAGVKDTSALLPGHGGALDRIDSLLFASPLLFLYVSWAGL